MMIQGSKIQLPVEIIVATDPRGAIGKDNKLLWHLPADLKFFKETTRGHIVVMGRKTFESIGKPLPERTNIVLSRKLKSDGNIVVVRSPEEIYKYSDNKKKFFIIGGAEMYRYFLPMTDVVYRTLVMKEYPEADTFFPIEEFYSQFSLQKEECFEPDARNPVAYCFQKWIRK